MGVVFFVIIDGIIEGVVITNCFLKILYNKHIFLTIVPMQTTPKALLHQCHNSSCAGAQTYGFISNLCHKALAVHNLTENV